LRGREAISVTPSREGKGQRTKGPPFLNPSGVRYDPAYIQAAFPPPKDPA